MKYTVVATICADYQLADIGLRASDRQVVTDASDRIERLLKSDPEQRGELRPDGFRSLVIHPLIATFEVSQDDRKVTVRSILYRP